MDRVVAARKLIGELVKAEQIEVRRIEIVGRDLAQLVETLKRPPTGQELEEWLDEHAQVKELYAAAGLLDELVDRYLTEPKSDVVVAARHPELERQIRDAPDSSGPYLVYADWLQEQGDPMGELITLGVATDDNATARFDRHLKRYDAYLLGGLGSQLPGRAVLHWRHGFVKTIEEEAGRQAQVPWRQLLPSRVCELVESIVLRGNPEAVESDIAALAPDTMRTLTLEVFTGPLPASLMKRPLHSLTVQGHAGITLEQDTLPSSLERLVLRVPDVTSAPIELTVRELVLGLTPRTAAFLIQTRLPRLEKLALDLGGADASTVPELLSPLRLPSLRQLTLCDGQIHTVTFEALAKLPLAAQITSLGLVNLGLTDDTIAPIVAVRGFKSLDEIDVSFNEMSREGLSTARGLAPSVISSRQHRRGHAMEQRVRKLAGTRLQVAEEIADPKMWRRAGIDGHIRWGRYRGEAEYELFITADLSRYGCSCPSSIQPCKHVIALALVAERTPLSAAPSNGIETRVTTRAGLTDLLLASIDEDQRT